MEEQRLLCTMDKTKVIDQDLAQQEIISFILSSGKSIFFSFPMEKIENLAKATYSYFYHEKQKEGFELNPIDYYLGDFKISEKSIIGFAGGNSIHLANDINFAPIMLTQEQYLHALVDVMFHELKHTTEVYDPTFVSNDHNAKISNFTTMVYTSTDQFLDIVDIAIENPDRYPYIKFTSEDLLEKVDEIGQYIKKIYLESLSEKQAFETASRLITKIIDSAKESYELSKDDIELLDEIKFCASDKCEGNIQFAKESLKNIELSDDIKESFLGFVDDCIDSLKTTISDRKQIPADDQNSLDVNEQDIELFSRLSTGILALVYDDKLAQNLAETILSAYDKDNTIEPSFISTLIYTTKFSPSIEQFDRITKAFQNYKPYGTFDSSSYNPLFKFVCEMQNIYTPEFLISSFEKDNPNFYTQLNDFLVDSHKDLDCPLTENSFDWAVEFLYDYNLKSKNQNNTEISDKDQDNSEQDNSSFDENSKESFENFDSESSLL